jgi:hypothetical protein
MAFILTKALVMMQDPELGFCPSRELRAEGLVRLPWQYRVFVKKNLIFFSLKMKLLFMQ